MENRYWNSKNWSCSAHLLTYSYMISPSVSGTFCLLTNKERGICHLPYHTSIRPLHYKSGFSCSLLKPFVFPIPNSSSSFLLSPFIHIQFTTMYLDPKNKSFLKKSSNDKKVDRMHNRFYWYTWTKFKIRFCISNVPGGFGGGRGGVLKVTQYGSWCLYCFANLKSNLNNPQFCSGKFLFLRVMLFHRQKDQCF